MLERKPRRPPGYNRGENSPIEGRSRRSFLQETQAFTLLTTNGSSSDPVSPSAKLPNTTAPAPYLTPSLREMRVRYLVVSVVSGGSVRIACEAWVDAPAPTGARSRSAHQARPPTITVIATHTRWLRQSGCRPLVLSRSRRNSSTRRAVDGPTRAGEISGTVIVTREWTPRPVRTLCRLGQARRNRRTLLQRAA